MFRRSLSFTLMILMALGLGMFNPTSFTNPRLNQPGPGWKSPQPALLPAGDSPGAVPTLRGEEAISRLKRDGSYDSLAQAMAAARYGVNWVDHPRLKRLSGAYEAQNPAQGFTSYFTPDGLYLMSAQGNGPGWTLQMKLSGIGYGDQLTGISSGILSVKGNRIELGRRKLDSVSSAPTALTEWYENQADGLEQGLTIKATPAGQVEGEWLGVAYGLDTLLTPHLEVGGQGIDFIDRSGERVLRYDHLVVRDATGRELTSQMELTDRQVLLKFDDRKAVYPVTIDPTFGQQSKLTASDGAASDQFGNSVAISGEMAVVGAIFDDINGNFNQGSAYVFVRNGTTWSQQQKLTASDGAPNDLFGVSVAISGETVVVGAYQSDIGGNGDQGAAYIYVRAGTIWSQQQKLTASDGVASDYFGVSVGISGETVVAGVITPNFRGSAYVFVRAGASWSQQQKLTASDGAMGDFFAASVAISGETVVVGAGSDDIGANNNQGSAYVFVRSGTSWSQQQKLIASDGVASDQFGVSVAISGETVVVGASSDTVGTNVFQGSAYVVVRTGTTWTQQQQLRASDGVMNAFFGNSVGIDGETVVVGAYNDRIGTNFAQGSSYVFVLDCVCPTMTAMVSGGGTICAGSNSTVTVTVSGGTAPYTVTLDNGGGTMTGTGPVFNFSVSPASTTTYSLKYGTGSGTCPITSSGSATVTITQPPTTANAGPDQLVCGTSPATLAANTPVVGSGSWSVMAGPSSSPSQFSNPADPTATFTPAGGFGTYFLQWTIANPPCAAATDTVAVTFDACLERSFLLVADTSNNRIQKFDGNVWTVISTTGAENGVAGFRLPEAVVADTTGTTLYVADTGNNRVLKSTDSGTSWTVIASSGAGLNPLQVRAPSGLALDLAGNLYISDTLNKRVVRLPDGNPGAAVVLASTGAGSGQVNEPQGLAVSQDNFLFVADKANSRILKIANCHTVAIANTGTNVATSGTGLNPGQVRAPQGVAVSNAGDLVVADTGNNRILQFAGGNAGLAITYGGTGSGIGGLAGQFRSPEGVVFAGFTTGIFAGGTTLVVGDTANNRVQARKLPGGVWSLVAGTPNPPQSATTGSGVGQFRAPSKIR